MRDILLFKRLIRSGSSAFGTSDATSVIFHIVLSPIVTMSSTTLLYIEENLCFEHVATTCAYLPDQLIGLCFVRGLCNKLSHLWYLYLDFHYFHS